MPTPDTPDRIFLRGLAVECIIGFIDWERRIRQTVVIDLEMPADCRRVLQMILGGASYQEMSQQLQAAEGTLRVKVLRCRKRAVELRARWLERKDEVAL